MEDLRVKDQKKKKKVWKLKLLLFWRKRKWWIILGLIFLIILFFPEQSGTAIGQWITNFVGSLIENIKI